MKLKTLTCPNCSQTNNFLAEVCTQCGINFSKYFEELEKAEELRRHIEEQERLEAQKRQEEEERQRKEKEAEALRRREEEKQKAEAARLEREEAERRLKEEERQKAEAARIEREEAERRLKEEEGQKAEAPSTSPSMPASVFWSDGDKDGSLATHHLLRDANDLPRVLSRYVGATIGLSFGSARTIRAVRLITVRKDHFQVLFISRKVTAIFPFHSLDLVAESPDGISAESPDISPVFPAVLQVAKPFFI
jgi:hypothetical protein